MDKTKTAKACTVDWRKLEGRWQIGDHAIFDARRRTLMAKDSSDKCPPRAAQVLAYLLSRDDHWAKHEELAHAIWSNGAVAPDTLYGAIRKARKALGADSECLESGEKGHSTYQLKRVRRLDDDEHLVASSSTLTEKDQSGRTIGYTAAAIIGVIAIAGAGLGLMHVFDSREAPRPWAKSQANTSGPAPINPPVGDDAPAGEPAAPVGALSTLRYHLFGTPNITADWLSRVVSGNQSYSEPTSRAGVAYADGLRAYAEGDYDRARQRIEAALTAAPDTPDYKAGLVAVEAAAGNRDTAQSILDELETAELKYPAPTRLTARLRYLTHAAETLPAEDRLAVFDDLLEQMTPVFAGSSTAVAGALAGRGHALIALERWDEAYTTFQDALAITRELPYHYSTWWSRALIAPRARAAREGGHCDTEAPRLEGTLNLPTLTQQYSTVDSAIAIEATRCLIALDRAADAAPYAKALRIAWDNGVLTDSQRAQIQAISEQLDEQSGA
ncbi:MULTISPECIES: tetratricopeptide repeat protein [Salinisphaera]|nr:MULTISPECIES: tetratricopeptide repeat protein [Salinisphaera]MAS08874.1 hypothetical protein [Salinisphaera sp.]